MAEPVQIIEESDSLVSIKWDDGAETSYSAANLRRNCPCAACIDEWTGRTILDSTKVPDDLAFRHISIVGRYALNFHFTDGHDSGIFSFAYLHNLVPG